MALERLDESVLQDLHDRKPETIERVVRAHAGDLLRAALGLGLPESEAEEMVQATFAAFLDAAARFEGRSSIRTFLFGILYNKSLALGRRASRELATDPGDQIFEAGFDVFGHWSPGPKGPDAEADVREISELIAQCLESVPPRQRAAFQLKEVEGESNEAVCNMLGVADTHLRVLLFRARNRLRACIEGKWKSAS